MNSLAHWLLTYLLNSLWQVSVIALASLLAARLLAPAGWRARNLLFVAALPLAVLLPGWSAATSSPRPGESIAVSILPGSFEPGSLSAAIRHPAIAHRYSALLRFSPAISSTVVFVYLGFLLYRAGMLLWRWRGTQRLLEDALGAELTGELVDRWQRWTACFELEEVRLFTSKEVACPVTLGFRRPALLVPPDFLSTASQDELAAALCHELAHVARRDFAVNLLLEILSLPVAFHPACWLLKRQIDESRELACDAMAARASDDSGRGGADAYARSLLSLARTLCSAPASTVTNALGIFEASILEKRIMNLIDRTPVPTRAGRLLSGVIGWGSLAVTCIGVSAFTLQPATAQSGYDLKPFLGTWKTTVNGQPAVSVELMEYQGKLVGSVSNGDFGLDEKNNNAITGWESHPGGAPIVEAAVAGETLSFKILDSGGPLSWQLTLAGEGKAELRISEPLPNGSAMPALEAVKASEFPAKQETERAPDAKAGYTAPHLLSAVNPEYTPEARAAKFSGKCVVALTINTQGSPENVRVERPVGMGLDENAINAVKQYRFTPAMQDGVPIAKRVHMEVEFRYY